jgi:hypothetical protein
VRANSLSGFAQPFRILVIGLWSALLVACNHQARLDSTVFIVTKGGDNIKLALVRVSAFGAEWINLLQFGGRRWWGFRFPEVIEARRTAFSEIDNRDSQNSIDSVRRRLARLRSREVFQASIKKPPDPLPARENRED